MRYAVASLAKQYPIYGIVENLEDRRVRIVMEGPLETLNAFLDRLIEIAPGHIKKMERYLSDPTGEFQTFEIRR